MRILYHLPLSPYARKVRLALAEKRIPFELKAERVWERREAFLAMNPAGTVPVLVEENGLVIADSYAICEYLDEAYPDTPLLGRTLAERAEVRRLVAWFDTRFAEEVTRNLIWERHLKRHLGKGNPDGGAIRAGYANLKPHLDTIGWLAEHRPWLARRGLGAQPCRARLVQPPEVAPRLPRPAGRPDQRDGAAAPLRRPRLLNGATPRFSEIGHKLL